MSNFIRAALLSLGCTLAGGTAFAQVSPATPDSGNSCKLLPDGSVKTTHVFTPADGVQIFVEVQGSRQNFKGASVLLMPGKKPFFAPVDSAYLNPNYDSANNERKLDSTAAILGAKAIGFCLDSFIPS